jgi:hypothetical protein
VDDPDNLPLELLKNISRIGLAFSKDDQGKKTAKAVLELLPQSKQLPPNNHTWNEDLLEILHIGITVPKKVFYTLRKIMSYDIAREVSLIGDCNR